MEQDRIQPISAYPSTESQSLYHTRLERCLQRHELNRIGRQASERGRQQGAGRDSCSVWFEVSASRSCRGLLIMQKGEALAEAMQPAPSFSHG